MTTPDTETYLRRATRGLWGRVRRDATAELRAHLHDRVQHHQLLGLGEPDARRAALHDLGDPRLIRAGLTRVHTAPTALTLSALLTLPAAFGVVTLTRAAAQVPAVSHTDTYQTRTDYLDLGALRAEIRRQGGTLDGPPERLVVKLPGQPPAPLDWLGRPPYTTDINGLLLKQGQRVLVSANIFLYSLLTAGVSARVTGWTNPTLKVGDVTLKLGTSKAPLTAYELYTPAAGLIRHAIGGNPTLLFKGPNDAVARQQNWSAYHTRVPGGAGRVYALVTVTDCSRFCAGGSPHPTFGNANLVADIAQADADGDLTFRLPTVRAVRLSGTVNGLKRDLRALATSDGASAANAAWGAQAGVLLELSGQIQPQAGAYRILPRTDEVKAGLAQP